VYQLSLLCYFVIDLCECSRSRTYFFRHFPALRDAGLKLNASKCPLGINRITYLGHIISKHGIEVDPDKVQAVRDFFVPQNTSEVRAFHGLCN
jgi:hypothetical protein